MEISKRLFTLVKYVPQGSKVTDIGTDHGYVPIYLVKNNIVEKVIGVDVNRGPLQSAAKAVEEACLEDKITLRLGNGLQVIQPGEVNTVIIAGMGGSTMIDILTAGEEVLQDVQRLILQPMIGGASLRKWLVENNWVITNEDLLVEDGRIYEVIVSEPNRGSAMEQFSQGQLEIGPKLLEKKHPLLDRHIERIINGYEEIIKEVAKGKSIEAQEKQRELLERLMEIKKVIPWD